jgi:hypothetical protein
LDQLRRAAEWRRQEQRSARALITDADIIALFEPRTPREASPSAGDGDGDGTLTTSLDSPPPVVAPHRAVASVPGFVSPALALLAAVSILQGYTLLNVVPAGGWQTSAILFAAVTFPLSVLLTRPHGGGPRTITEKAVASSAALVAVMTVTALVIDRPSVTHLLGVSDLMFALVALGAVLVTERATRPTGLR